MLRKTKFGLNLGDVTIKPKQTKKIEHPIKSKENIDVVCSICQEHHSRMFYVNCKLKGVKFEQIGRYKDCDKAICLDCIERCEEVNVGCEVMFKYKVTKSHPRKPSRRSFYTIYKSGTVDNIENDGTFIVNTKKYTYEMKKENIMYKLNTCPWCRSHLLNHWTYLKEKYPKIKKKIIPKSKIIPKN